jgi:hypothetical protein
MVECRYWLEGAWYKGNTHIHSTVSDGGLAFAELAELYAGAGYDFLVRTDHWHASAVAQDDVEYPIVWLDGVELDGFDERGGFYHVVCIGSFEGITRASGFSAGLAAARSQGGLLILAHPMWTGNSFAEALRWGFHGVEIYNHVCRYLNGKGEGHAYWQALLERRPHILGFAVDDAHLRPEHPGWNGGWVMVQAEDLSARAITESLRAGRFYSSMGPEFRTIRMEDGAVTVETSPVQFVRLVGPASRGQRVGTYAPGAPLCEATLTVPEDWAYAYLEIEDACGRRAWTNTLAPYNGHDSWPLGEDVEIGD